MQGRCSRVGKLGGVKAVKGLIHLLSFAESLKIVVTTNKEESLKNLSFLMSCNAHNYF
jgi:hypothetical protein